MFEAADYVHLEIYHDVFPGALHFQAHDAPALVNQEMQATKIAVAACAQSLERLGDENPAVTMLTTTRNGAVENAVPGRTCTPLRVSPRDLRVRHDYLVIPARVLTAAALLFLPLVTAACQTGWTPSHANAAWGPRCFVVPHERSTSLFRCVDLCKEHGGTPACIGSAAENDFVAALRSAPLRRSPLGLAGRRCALPCGLYMGLCSGAALR